MKTKIYTEFNGLNIHGTEEQIKLYKKGIIIMRKPNTECIDLQPSDPKANKRFAKAQLNDHDFISIWLLVLLSLTLGLILGTIEWLVLK